MMCAHIHISVPSRRQRLSQAVGSNHLNPQPAPLAGLGTHKPSPTAAPIPPLSQLLERYPLAYDQGLLSQFSPAQLPLHQTQVRKAWEVSICHVVIDYSLRQQRQQPGSAAMTVTANNPTLLDPQQLHQTVQSLLQSLANPQGIKVQARQFRRQYPTLETYASFKQGLYAYLKLPESTFGGAQLFNQRLEQVIDSILPDYDGAAVTDLLVLRTCTQLLSYWIVESSHQRDHARFLNLIANLGAMATVTWLLRIVLLCPNAQRHLEKRMAILLSHYSQTPWQEVLWLVETMEIFEIANVLVMSEVQLPLFRQKQMEDARNVP